MRVRGIQVYMLIAMGAVIGMDGPRMNRKSLFDIGIAGPLAGLVLIVPFVIIGILIALLLPAVQAAREAARA